MSAAYYVTSPARMGVMGDVRSKAVRRNRC